MNAQELIPYIGMRLEQLRVVKLVKKLPAFHETLQCPQQAITDAHHVWYSALRISYQNIACISRFCIHASFAPASRPCRALPSKKGPRYPLYRRLLDPTADLNTEARGKILFASAGDRTSIARSSSS
jgi:hypothetical protein